jgi:hypothetical protein
VIHYFNFFFKFKMIFDMIYVIIRVFFLFFFQFCDVNQIETPITKCHNGARVGL